MLDGQQATSGRPRVLHMIEKLVPYGAGQSMMNICTALHGRYEPVVAAFYGGQLSESLADQGIAAITMRDEKQRAGEDRGALGLSRRLGFCWRAMRTVRPDIIHTHSDSTNTLGRVAAHTMGIPTVAHVRGREELCGTGVYRLAYRLAHRGHTRVIVVSSGLGQIFGDATGVPYQVIHNAVDSEHLRKEGQLAGDVRAELGLERDAFVVGTLAGFHREKDYPMLLRCAQRVCLQTEDIHFVCAGDGPRYEEMTQLRDHLGLEGRVHFLGYRKDTAALLAAFDVFVLMSEGEGFPRSVIEAMWLQRPVVATDVIGINEALDDGVEGYLVGPGDDEAAARRIMELYRDRELRESMGRAGRRRVESRHTLADLAESIATVYEELLAEVRR